MGGQTAQVRSEQPRTQVLDKMTELYWNDVSKQWRVRPRESMLHARVGFGCALFKGRSHLVVSGGFASDFNPTAKTEYFSLGENKWHRARDMNVARTAHSMCEAANGRFVYAFGGQGVNASPLTSIERVPIAAGDSDSLLGSW